MLFVPAFFLGLLGGHGCYGVCWQEVVSDLQLQRTSCPLPFDCVDNECVCGSEYLPAVLHEETCYLKGAAPGQPCTADNCYADTTTAPECGDDNTCPACSTFPSASDPICKSGWGGICCSENDCMQTANANLTCLNGFCACRDVRLAYVNPPPGSGNSYLAPYPYYFSTGTTNVVMYVTGWCAVSGQCRFGTDPHLPCIPGFYCGPSGMCTLI